MTVALKEGSKTLDSVLDVITNQPPGLIESTAVEILGDLPPYMRKAIQMYAPSLTLQEDEIQIAFIHIQKSHLPTSDGFVNWEEIEEWRQKEYHKHKAIRNLLFNSTPSFRPLNFPSQDGGYNNPFFRVFYSSKQKNTDIICVEYMP